MVRATSEAKVSDSNAKWEVFDFDTNWSKVLPVLDHPLALRALNAGMAALCHEKGTVWCPEDAPWSYSRTTHWLAHADAAFRDSDQYAQLEEWADAEGCFDEDPDEPGEEYLNKHDELWRQFLPQPRTPNWYRCWGACHRLAAWNCAIGELVFPDMAWGVILAEKHSTAHGWTSSREVFVDILWGMDHTYAEIKDAVWEGEWRSLTDDIELLEKEALSPNC